MEPHGNLVPALKLLMWRENVLFENCKKEYGEAYQCEFYEMLFENRKFIRKAFKAILKCQQT